MLNSSAYTCDLPVGGLAASHSSGWTDACDAYEVVGSAELRRRRAFVARCTGLKRKRGRVPVRNGPLCGVTSRWRRALVCRPRSPWPAGWGQIAHEGQLRCHMAPWMGPPHAGGAHLCAVHAPPGPLYGANPHARASSGAVWPAVGGQRRAGKGTAHQHRASDGPTQGRGPRTVTSRSVPPRRASGRPRIRQSRRCGRHLPVS